MTSDLSLTLYEMPDIEEGVVRLDSTDMKILGVIAGETVLVEGSRRVYLTVQTTGVADRNQRLAQVSALTASNIGFFSGQKVRLIAERLKMPVAELVTLQADDDLDQLHLMARKKQIGGFWNKRVVQVEDELSLPTLDRRPICIKVAATQPQCPVQIGHATEFVVATRKASPNAIRIGAVREAYRICQHVANARFTRGLISAARSVFLTGPKGCGKALMVAKLASDNGYEFHRLDAYQMLDRAIGPTGLELGEMLSDLGRRGRTVLLLDHLEALIDAEHKSSAVASAAYNVTSQIHALLDEIPTQPNVLVFGVASGEAAFRFPLQARFDIEIPVDAPNRWGRHEVLLLATEGKLKGEDTDLAAVADITQGMTGGDIVSMVRRAEMLSAEGRICKDDIMTAFRSSSATAASEVHCDIPQTPWEEVAGLDDVKQLMHETLSWSLFHHEQFAVAGVRPPQSVLLSGAHGTGKTSLVRALAGHMPLHFIEVSCPLLLARPVQDGQRYLEECFLKARRKAPCLVFFDDIDVLFDPPKCEVDESSSQPHPLVGQLVAEMDRLISLLGVFVVGATSRPDRLNADILRAGRFDFVIPLPMPDLSGRKKILHVHARKLPLAADIDFDRLASNTHGMSPSEIASMCNRVGLMALRHSINTPEMAGLLPVVTAELFDQALRGRKS